MSVWYVWILACRVSLKGSMPGISHRGWNCPVVCGVDAGLAPLRSVPCPSFFSIQCPSLSPRAGSGPDRGEGSSCGDFQSFPGEVGATLPLLLSPLPSVPVPSSLPLHPLPLSPPRFFPPSPPETGKRAERACPVLGSVRTQAWPGRDWGPVQKADLQVSC